MLKDNILLPFKNTYQLMVAECIHENVLQKIRFAVRIILNLWFFWHLIVLKQGLEICNILC